MVANGHGNGNETNLDLVFGAVTFAPPPLWIYIRIHIYIYIGVSLSVRLHLNLLNLYAELFAVNCQLHGVMFKLFSPFSLFLFIYFILVFPVLVFVCCFPALFFFLLSGIPFSIFSRRISVRGRENGPSSLLAYDENNFI